MVKPLFSAGAKKQPVHAAEPGRIFSQRKTVLTDDVLDLGYAEIGEYSDFMARLGRNPPTSMSELSAAEDKTADILKRVAAHIATLESVLADWPQQRAALEKQASLSTIESHRDQAARRIRQYEAGLERLEQLRDFETLNAAASAAVFAAMRKTLSVVGTTKIMEATRSAVENQNKLLKPKRSLLSTIFGK